MRLVLKNCGAKIAQGTLASATVPDWIKEPYQKIGEEEEGHGDYPLELLSRLTTTSDAEALVRRGVAIGINLRDRYFQELDEMVFQGRRW